MTERAEQCRTAEGGGMRRRVELTINSIKVQLSRRPGGGLRVSSKELPGIILSGADVFEVLCDVPKAIKVLKTFGAKRPVLSALAALSVAAIWAGVMQIGAAL